MTRRMYIKKDVYHKNHAELYEEIKKLVIFGEYERFNQKILENIEINGKRLNRRRIEEHIARFLKEGKISEIQKNRNSRKKWYVLTEWIKERIEAIKREKEYLLLIDLLKSSLIEKGVFEKEHIEKKIEQIAPHTCMTCKLIQWDSLSGCKYVGRLTGSTGTCDMWQYEHDISKHLTPEKRVLYLKKLGYEVRLSP